MKTRSDHFPTGNKVMAKNNLHSSFALRMVSCHCSSCLRTQPTMERNIFSLPRPVCWFLFWPGQKTARPNVAVGEATESKRFNFNLKETCLSKRVQLYLGCSQMLSVNQTLQTKQGNSIPALSFTANRFKDRYVMWSRSGQNLAPVPISAAIFHRIASKISRPEPSGIWVQYLHRRSLAWALHPDLPEPDSNICAGTFRNLT